jgi:hypothetical protein
MTSKRLWLLLVSVLCAGCAESWTVYEDSLYESLRVPGKESYASHAELLGRIVEEREQAGRKPPPGVFAEYGMYLARTGRTQDAARYFRAEKEAYPESATFVSAMERAIEGRRAFGGEE